MLNICFHTHGRGPQNAKLSTDTLQEAEQLTTIIDMRAIFQCNFLFNDNQLKVCNMINSKDLGLGNV